VSIEQIIDALWLSQQRGDVFPGQWRGKLGLHEGYRVQLAILGRKVAGGERQAGWKAGLTADAMRELFGAREPVFGYLLESARLPSRHAFRLGELRTPMLEHELMLTLRADLSGPAATPEDATRALASVAPAFEIVEQRGADMKADLALAVTDNVAQRAFVHGAARALPPGFDFGQVEAEVRVNGEVKARLIGREVIDNQTRTLAWLANTLHRFGRRLEAGQVVMSGSFTKPMPIAAGDRFETVFSGVGAVSATFR
jgi:2-keto-4-pentenoate hydratase